MANDLTNQPPERRGPLPTGEYEHQPGTALKTRSTALVSSTISREPHLRQGIYDYEVEIVRQGTFYEGFVSQVHKGDAFQFMQGNGMGRWFGALSNVKRMPGDSRWGATDFIFQFDGLEILQAAPTYERPTMLQDMTDRKQVEDHARLLDYRAKDMPNDLPEDQSPIDPVAKHKLMLTSELGDLYTSEDVPGTDVVDTARHRRSTKPDDVEDVDFKDQ